MLPPNYNNYYYQRAYLHPHGQYLPYHYPNLIPIYGPNVFPHPWPHYFPPYIPQHNYYPHFNENNRNNNINNNNGYNNNINNINNVGERYIPQDDDYDYSEFYNFGNHNEEKERKEEEEERKEEEKKEEEERKEEEEERKGEEKKEELNINEIKNEQEHNSQDNIILDLKKSEINHIFDNQENYINNPNDINLRESQFNNSGFYLLKQSQQDNDNENANENNIKNSIKNSNNNNNINIEYNIDNNNEIIIESNHEHPLIYINNLDKSCTICHHSNKENPGYNCKQCPVILCIKCAERVFNKNKKISIHPHPLILKFKNKWKCNICEINFIDSSSFSCDKCGFNICSFCLIS